MAKRNIGKEILDGIEEIQEFKRVGGRLKMTKLPQVTSPNSDVDIDITNLTRKSVRTDPDSCPQ